MDKAFLKENNLLEERNRMMRLCEMITVGGSAYEEEDDPNAAPADAGAPVDPSAAPADPNAGAPADPSAMGGDPNAAAPADPNAAGPADGGDAVETGLAPQVPDDAAPMDAPAEPEEDVEEVDVDDLTDAQEDTEHKVDRLSHTLEAVLNSFKDITKHIEDNEAHAEALHQELKAELEKRNPTPEEQAAKQVNLSTPFSVKPEDYQPAIDPEVSATPEPQYQIHQSDIDKINNWQEIAKSLSDNSRSQSLKDIFGY